MIFYMNRNAAWFLHHSMLQDGQDRLTGARVPLTVHSALVAEHTETVPLFGPWLCGVL